MKRDTTRIGDAYERIHGTDGEYLAVIVIAAIGVTLTAIFGVWLAWTIERTWTAINADLLDVPAAGFWEE